MARKTLSLEEISARWAEGSARAVREAIEHPTNPAQYDWGLGFAETSIHKLTRKGNRQRVICLSGPEVEEMKLQDVQHVIVLPLPEGGFQARAATQEDMLAAHRRQTESPPPNFPAPDNSSNLAPLEFICAQCGKPLQAHSPRRLFCNTCQHERALASCRA